MDALVLKLQKNFQTRNDRKSGWSWTALSVIRHSLLMFTFSWMDDTPLYHSLYRSPWHTNDTCGLTLVVVSSWFIVLWLTKVFNFCQIFACHRGHRSSVAFLAIGSARVTILCNNPIDALVIPLLVWKFFCNPSTSPSSFSETCNNNRQIVFCKNHFQSNFQMHYLHN